MSRPQKPFDINPDNIGTGKSSVNLRLHQLDTSSKLVSNTAILWHNCQAQPQFERVKTNHNIALVS